MEILKEKMNLDIVKDVLEVEETENSEFVITKLIYNDFYGHLIDDLAILDQENNFIDLKLVENHFKQLGRLSVRQAMKLLCDSMQILKKEPNLVVIESPTYVFGDIHGQYFDLISVLKAVDLRTHCIVFLGNYVDRGSFSTEVYFYLLLLKTHYPKRVFLLRGNHESKLMTTKYTFKRECIDKYNEDVYDLCVNSFKTLPLAAIVQQSVFCSHGGISKDAPTIESINSLNRFVELEYSGPICDLLWSDPNPDYIKGDSFAPNTKRRCSFLYNYEDIKSFLNRNNLKCIVRGHEMAQEGFKLYEQYLGTPSVITLFSAPNYCETFRNKGAFFKVDYDNLQLQTYYGTTKPFVLPNNLDGINWSFPFVGQKLVELYIDILKGFDLDESAFKDEPRLIENEIVKAQNLWVAMALIRAERENLNQNDTNSISLMAIKNPLADPLQFKTSSCQTQKPLKQSGLSLNVPNFNVPLITKEAAKRSTEEVLAKAVIEVDNTTDTATIAIKNNKQQRDKSFYKCCFK